MRLVFIGSREWKPDMLKLKRDFIKDVLSAYQDKCKLLIIGDNPNGVDYRVSRMATHEFNYNLMIMHIDYTPRLTVPTDLLNTDYQPRVQYNQLLQASGRPYRGGSRSEWFEIFKKRDRAILGMLSGADDKAFFIWNGKSKGTKLAYDYARWELQLIQQSQLVNIAEMHEAEKPKQLTLF